MIKIKCTSNRWQEPITVGREYELLEADALTGSVKIRTDDGRTVWLSAKNFRMRYE